MERTPFVILEVVINISEVSDCSSHSKAFQKHSADREEDSSADEILFARKFKTPMETDTSLPCLPY